LADIVADVRVPDAPETRPVVDLNDVQALQEARRKAKAAAEAKAKREAELKAKREAEEERKRKLANPERYWVQVATGRNRSGMSYDLKRLRKQYGDIIGSRGGGIVASGNTSLLLIGPLKSAAKAKDMAASLGKAGNQSFVYHSEAGEEVTLIGGD
jgi:cell division septation protein DedD